MLGGYTIRGKAKNLILILTFNLINCRIKMSDSDRHIGGSYRSELSLEDFLQFAFAT